jgi:transposase
MTTRKRYLRYCGIDVGKNRHVFCIKDAHGDILQKPMGFSNHTDGFEKLLSCLKKSGRAKSILIGMEATGHYWYSLHDCLNGHGYSVVVINPIITAAKIKTSIRKGKTDKRDSKKIAQILINGEYNQSIVPADLAMNCRQLTRLHNRMTAQRAKVKQFIRARLHPVWPEYETLFSDLFGATGRMLLDRYPTPQDLLETTVQDLEALIRKSSMGRFKAAKALEIWQSAQHSVGISRGLDSIRFNIRLLLSQLEAFEPFIEKMTTQIEQVAQTLPDYLLTLPGATRASVVSLYGELSPIHCFTGGDQVVAFAGLDPVIYQSGDPVSDQAAIIRHISKRGSPYLRHTLWSMALRACWQDPHFMSIYRKKRARGKHHLTAVTAVAGHLCHITWRIMIDERDYIPGHAPKKDGGNS